MFQKSIISMLVFLWAPLMHAGEFGPYILLDSYTHSEPMAIEAINGDWDGQLYSGELAFSVNRVEIGIDWKRWRMGFIYRRDSFSEFTPDTVYLKHHVENNLDLIPGELLDLYLTTNTIESNGLSMTYNQSIANWGFDITVSYLEGKRLTSGSFSGSAEALATNDYDLDFEVDYFYSSDQLFGREVVAPNGKGFGIDLNIDWDFSDNWNFNLNIKDLLTTIYWQNTPRTTATGNNDTKEYDENGYVIFNPVISGLETNQDYAQTLPRKVEFTTAYLWDKRKILFEVRDYDIKRFYSVGIGFNEHVNRRINLFYDVTASAVKYEYHNRWMTFSITTDEFNLHKARTFGLEFSAKVSF